MSHIRMLGICRGPGCGFVAFGGTPASIVSASLPNGEKLPVTLHDAGYDLMVARFPLVDSDVDIAIRCDDEQRTVRFGRLTSKVQSRLLTATKPELASTMRGFGPGDERATIEVTSIWPAAGANVVWRVRAVLSHASAECAPLVGYLLPDGSSPDAKVVILEDQLTQESRIVSFSVTLPEEVRHACVWVDAGESAFAWVDPELHERLLSHKRYLTHAPLLDPMYGVWLDEHPRGGERVTSVPGYTLLLAEGAELEEGGLWHLREALDNTPGALLAYCDEDRVIDGSPTKPLFKTMPSLTLLRSYDYLGSAILVADELLAQTKQEGFVTQKGLMYAVSLKAMEAGGRVARCQRMVCHVTGARKDPSETEAEEMRRALVEHLDRTDPDARVEQGPYPGTFRVVYPLPDCTPKVSVIIPSKDHIDLLAACLKSIDDLTDYANYEVIVVENNSEDDATFAYYDRVGARYDRIRVVTWEPKPGQEGTFNFPSLCNYGASCSTGELLLFLNNDTEVIDGGWMREMASQALRREVGVVGAKLLFMDGLVQHVGMFANELGNFAHINQNLSVDNPGYCLSAILPMEYSMVTGACQMMRRTVFDKLGGFDENLAVGFNDGDLCLTARELGYSVVCTPYALLHHREFSTRGREEGDAAKQVRLAHEKEYIMAKHAGYFSSQDPVINTNLKTLSDHWELRW